MIVLAKPKNIAIGCNPYNKILYKNIEAKGIIVNEWNRNRMIFGKYDILHIHWPENILNKDSVIFSAILLALLSTSLVWVKLRGKKIVWTAHNLESHGKLHPRLEKHYWAVAKKLIEGVIFLDSHSKIKIRTWLGKKKYTQIPHGNYNSTYINNINKNDARDYLKIPTNCQHLLIQGRLTKYKGIIEFVHYFREIIQSDLCLTIAGRPENKNFEKSLFKAAFGDERIRIEPKFIPDDELQIYYKSSDLVVLPYKKITNSGAAFLALSFNRPIFCPDLQAFKNLSNEKFKDWIFLYPSRNITSWYLLNTLKKIKNLKGSVKWDINWSHESIAKQTILFYKSLLQEKSLKG